VNYRFLASFASALALVAMLAAPTLAQTTAAGAPSYPAWTGARYPANRHIEVMLVHLDSAALAMAEATQRNATSTNLKKLAAAVISERSKEIAQANAAYQKQYGQAPPVWGPGDGGYMHGSGAGGHMDGSGAGGYGMMGGSGMMGGRGTGGYGQMMTYGDNYQMMMGDRSNWWGGSNAESGFVSALMRLDAMQISMASLGVRATDPDTQSLSRTIVASRIAELSRLANML